MHGEIMKLLEEINSRGTTVVVVTHNLEIVKAMNKRVITMRKALSLRTARVIIAMRISTFFYTIKQGLKNIWKNKMFSLASIATMTACIFLFGLFYTIVTNFQSMVKDAESGVAVTVFFDEGISQDKIDEIGDLIRARAEVSNLEFVSADDAWTASSRLTLKETKQQRRVLPGITHWQMTPAIPFI